MKLSKQSRHPVRTTDAQIEIALAKARDYDAVRPQAIEVAFRDTDDAFMVRLKSGVQLIIPRELLQGLSAASPDQLRDVVVEDFGSTLHWSQLDVDHYVPGLIEGVLGTRRWMSKIGKAGGSTKSEAKATAARENGTKGGRPKQIGLDGRQRDVTTKMLAKRGDTVIGTLRKQFGADFAPGVRSDMRLDTYLVRTGAHSLSDILKRKRP